MNIRSIVDDALKKARQIPDEGDQPSQVHRNRSKHFVEALAEQFRRHYEEQPTVRVLSKHHDLHRDEFGLNELLFDVLVCATSSVHSARDAVSLTFVTEGLWAVESEFARDTRQALFDFNKLVLAATKSKLFIGPLVSDEKAYLEPLLAPASKCSGDVFAALVTHPSDWPQAAPSAHIYKFLDSQWQAFESD